MLEEITTLVYLCDVYFHIFSRTTHARNYIISFYTFGNIAIFVNNRLGIERDNSTRTHMVYASTYNVRGGEWSFKNSGSRKILVEFHGSRSLVFQRLCASRSLVFYT